MLGSGTNTNGSGNDPADNETNPLSIGSRVLFGTVDADPFDGLLDNIRIWNDIQPLAALEALRQGDAIAVPESSAIVLAVCAVSGCIAAERRSQVCKKN
jgi:hypothetical protein